MLAEAKIVSMRRPGPEKNLYRLFLLSPARSDGLRAEMLVNPAAQFEMAQRIRNGGAPLGEVFTFLSGLYFRGKLAYSMEFARPFRRVPGVWVITSSSGLVPSHQKVTPEMLISYGKVPIDPKEKRYLSALQQSANELSQRIPNTTEIVLLGSVGTSKYVEPLIEIFGDRLKFPIDFVGRGDMSRGGLLLRCAAAREELAYVPLIGAPRHGPRPPKLPPKKY